MCKIKGEIGELENRKLVDLKFFWDNGLIFNDINYTRKIICKLRNENSNITDNKEIRSIINCIGL